MSSVESSGGDREVKKEVSESVFEYLLAEILAHSSTPINSNNADDASLSEKGSSSAPTFKLESLGYDVGYRYCEKVVANQRFTSTETLDTVKFLCKEFWEEVFKKKVSIFIHCRRRASFPPPVSSDPLLTSIHTAMSSILLIITAELDR